MIMNHEVYMGEVLLDTIKNELGEGEFVWYKDEMTRLSNETYRKKVYYLTKHFLFETKTTANSFSVKKISIIGDDLFTEKVILHISDNEDDCLYITRPNERDGGDIKGYNELTKQL